MEVASGACTQGTFIGFFWESAMAVAEAQGIVYSLHLDPPLWLIYVLPLILLQ
jgi:hypothetical protein